MLDIEVEALKHCILVDVAEVKHVEVNKLYLLMYLLTSISSKFSFSCRTLFVVNTQSLTHTVAAKEILFRHWLNFNVFILRSIMALLFLLFQWLFIFETSSDSTDLSRPNIIFMLADDIVCTEYNSINTKPYHTTFSFRIIL